MLETVENARGNTYPSGGLGLQVGVYFKGDSVHEVVVDDRDVEDVVRIVLQLIVPLSADAGCIVQSDQITIFIGADAVTISLFFSYTARLMTCSLIELTSHRLS